MDLLVRGQEPAGLQHVAAARHIDNRIMYTVGIAVLDMKLLGDDVKVAYAIPLSSTSKNPFFDRK